MSAEQTAVVETTDFLARQEGTFERCTVRAVAPVADTIVSSENPDPSGLNVPQSCFNAKHILVRLETVDGEPRTLAFDPSFTAYDDRLLTLRHVLEKGTAWYCHRSALTDGVRDWNVVLTTTPERARNLTENGAPFGALTIGTLTRHGLRSIKTLGGLLGSPHQRNRPDDVLTAYDRQQYDSPLPDGDTDIDAFLRAAPTERAHAEVVDVPSHNRLVLLLNGHTFPLAFSGRATSKEHTPTRLAEELGVRTVENLAGEIVSIAPNVHNTLLSFTPVGSNKTDTFALGVPRRS